MKDISGLNGQMGASLVELMATITIMGTVAGVGTPVVMNHIEQAKIQVDQVNLRILADAIRYSFLLNGSDGVSISEGSLETVIITLNHKGSASPETISLQQFIADPINHKQTNTLVEVPQTSSGLAFVLQKQTPIDKPFETIILNDIYYLTLP